MIYEVDLFDLINSFTAFAATHCASLPRESLDWATLPSHPPPIIEHGHSNQTLMVGAAAILPCKASGRSTPQISWLKSGEQIDLDGPEYEARFKQLEHTNPSVTFSRMPDVSTFPSAPGKPSFRNVTEDGVDLEWTAPESNGAALVNGYLLQYFSPEMGETWFNVPDYISGPRYRVENLKPLHSYVFIVRAENSQGIGPPSPMSDAIRTKPRKEESERQRANANMDLDIARQRIASEQLIKLEEARTINATAVKLTWK
ncbi:unnamed protein product, partial [Gongylonema pulchrum]|uniref:Fibronectin type-III domain-containing protein n=1 Tax=Gongylonema pulchrum TaxID=637853 RepID=A0A183EIW0_9BILA